MTARPFLKWAGGKTQLLPQMEPYLPARFGTYHEPFLGGGAMFFHLSSTGRITDAILSDMNLRLIRTYLGVRDSVEKVINALAYWKCDAETYTTIRDRFNLSEHRNGEAPAWETAALFIYLNKCCFNGLYRENPKGHFNVPFGHKKPDHTFLDPDNLRACSKALQQAVIVHQPFTQRLTKLVDLDSVGQIADSPPDFVYCDPPYIPLTETSDFTAYVMGGFGLDKHLLLAHVAERVKEAGAHLLMSNSGAARTREVYSAFEQIEVSARRSINSAATKRGPVTELLLR